MITIPRNSNTGIRIPLSPKPTNPQTPSDRREVSDRICYSAKEAAKKMSVSEQTIWKLARAGKIRFIRIGTRCLFPDQSLREDVSKMLQEPVSNEPPQHDEK
jgi:excisionase family DNA binding protein